MPLSWPALLLGVSAMADPHPYIVAKGRTGPTRRTSTDAADAIAPSRAGLQRVALRALAELEQGTPLQVAKHAGVTAEAIKPRLSELIALRLVEPTGGRARNPSGKSAAILRVTAAGLTALAST